ncbi:hypothetical protein MCEGKSH29_00034 [Candidatus Nanopelagicaceae bacterium]
MVSLFSPKSLYMSKLYPNFASFILTKVIKKIYSLLELFFKRSIRRIAIKNDVVKVTYFNSGAKLRLFNLDLHIGVIRDIKHEIMNHTNVELISWSISSHNGIVRKFLDVPDPVKFVNNKNWANLDIDLRDKFIKEYGGFLGKFDGFVVTHTPSFVQLFEELEKPILLINSTRYEAPYSNNSVKWKTLNQSLQRLTESKSLHVGSNNKGDQEYLFRKAGVESVLVPSVCDYLSVVGEFDSPTGLIFCRSSNFQDYIQKTTNGRFKTTYGRYVSYEEIFSSSAIVVLPQNISTMFLFEMATIGKKVFIPNANLLKDLARKVPGVLSELSYFQVNGFSTKGLDAEDMNNYTSPSFYDNWLSFADFYDSDLMPNVQLFDHLSELSQFSQKYFPNQEILSDRNELLREKRKHFVNSFIERLCH